MSAELLKAMADIQENLAQAQMAAAVVMRLLLGGASDETEGCTHPADQRAQVSGMGRPAFMCRACGAVVEVESGEANPS